MKKVYIKPSKHLGFKGAQKQIESEGYSEESAARILASKTRSASSEAKRKNPNLRKVKGGY